MSIYLYKKFMVSEPLKEVPDYVFELLASNDEVDNYKGSLDDTFTSSFKLENNIVKTILDIKDNYRLVLRTEKFIPDLPVYITLKRNDKDIDYFLMIKDDILDVEDGFVFAGDPLKFLDTIAPTTPDDYEKFKSNNTKVWVNFKPYEMTIHYEKIDFPDGMSIG